MGLFRKKKKIQIGSDTVVIKELSAKDLLEIQEQGITLDDAELLRRCTGLDIEDITPEAYLIIMTEIKDMHKDFFESASKQTKDKNIKKNLTTI